MIEFDKIDCACLIHGDLYEWKYVDILYAMLTRNLSIPIRLHVYTEYDRQVPEPYIKHSLIDWGISGPKKSWWYKMQMFNTDIFSGPLLYFDLDVVIVDNIDWIWQYPLTNFWTIRDFKRLWQPTFYGINSSIMWWDNTKTVDVWKKFTKFPIESTISTYRGDQDFITKYIVPPYLRFFDTDLVKSWRWECLDGGYDFHTRKHNAIGCGTDIGNASIMILHGNPKPHETSDLVIVEKWK
jgi:hypothetical protein